MDRSIGNIQIRQCKKKDRDAVAHILAHSFQKKFCSLTNLSNERIAELLKDTGFIRPMPDEGHLVAAQNDDVLGIISLKWKTQNRLKRQNALNFWQLCKKYGAVNLATFLAGMTILNKDVTDDECYIECIAVASKARGLGIGTKLLNFGKKFVENRLSLTKYTLFVTASNQRAVRLYEHLGFRVKNSLSSTITRFLVKESTWLYMVNELNPKAANNY